MSNQNEETAKELPGIATRRKNGFERPLDYLQICTWLLYPLILTHYFSFLYFLLWNNLASKVVLTVLFCVFAVLSFISVVCTCSIDPADDALCRISQLPQQNSDENQIYCYLCEIHVHQSSKHCRYCDKCVTRFDHHCKWLNTCIGEKNYGYFLSLVLFVFLLTSESFAISLALMIESFAIPTQFHNRVMQIRRFKHFLGSGISLVGLQTILVVSVAVLLMLGLMLIQLGGFHLMLLSKGLTTYDFIILEQKKARDQEAERLKKQIEMQQKQDKALIAQTHAAIGGGEIEDPDHAAERTQEIVPIPNTQAVDDNV